jgi:hypothetical protein
MHSKSLLIALALMAALVGLVGPAYACPSANGPSGLWNVPTAPAEPQNTYSLFVNHHTVDNELTRFGANIGTGLETPLEIGVTAYEPDVGDSRTVFNLKFQAMQEKEKAPSVAVGAIDLTKEGDRTFYLAATKRLDVPERGKEPQPVYGTVGVGFNNSSAALDGVFFGISYQLSDTSAVLLEHDAEDLNIGLRHHISDSTVFDVASVNNRLYLGLSYNGRR